MELSTHKRGAINELVACTWLLKQGYQVFRNVTPDGRIDIISEKDGVLTKIDVKTQINKYGKQQLEDGISIILIDKDLNCSWIAAANRV